MKEQRIVVEIGSDGRITADAEGFSGDACLRDLERLLEGLSPGAVAVERKPDAGTRRNRFGRRVAGVGGAVAVAHARKKPFEHQRQNSLRRGRISNRARPATRTSPRYGKDR